MNHSKNARKIKIRHTAQWPASTRINGDKKSLYSGNTKQPMKKEIVKVTAWPKQTRNTTIQKA